MNNRLIQGLVDPGKSFLFFLVFGTFGLTLASDALSSLVIEEFGTYLETRWAINRILIKFIVFALSTSLIITAIAITNLSRWLVSRPAIVAPKPLKATLRGLIVIASIAPPGKITPAQAAIEHHWNDGKGNLQHCWIICGGSQSLESARNIIFNQMQGRVEKIKGNPNEYQLTDLHDSQRQLRISLRNLETPDEADNPHETFELVNSIYLEAANQGIEDSAVIADYTGGTKSMTAGLILACANPERRMEFMKPGGYLPDGRADSSKPSVATEVQINFRLKAAKPLTST